MSDIKKVSIDRFRWVWKPLATALIIGIVAMVLVTALSTGTEVLDQLRKFNPRYGIACFLIVLTAWICNGVRLKLLSSSLGYHLPLRRCVQVTLISEFGIASTPSGTGGVLLRVLLLRRLGVPAGRTLSMLATDGALDFVFFILMIPLAIGSSFKSAAKFDWRIAELAMLLVVVVIGALVGIWWWDRRRMRPGNNSNTGKPLAELPRWRRRLRARKRLLKRRLAHSVHDFRGGLHTLFHLKRGTLLATFMVVLIQWSCRYGILPVLLWGFDFPADPFPLMLFQGLLFFGGLFLVVPGGSGGIEVTFALVMSQVIPAELIGVVLVLWRFFTYYLYLLGGGILFATVPFTFEKQSGENRQ